jgi:hypothetical protein
MSLAENVGGACQRRPSAVHDAERVTRLNQVHQAPKGTFGENSLIYIRNIQKGKSKKKSLMKIG